MTQWTLISFKRKARKARGKETTWAKEKSKGNGKGKGKHNEKGQSAGKGKSSQETFRGTCRICGKTRHKWSECWAKGGGAAKQTNNVGGTEKTGDVNWIMMFQQPNDGQTSTTGHEEWRCSGNSVSCKNAHESHRASHAESDYTIPNPDVAGPLATQQSGVDQAHQFDIRPGSVNSVILSSTAKLVVDSGWFDHCCPLEFATQFEPKE